MKSNKYWFKPKKYGLGAYPDSWEGWSIIFLFVTILYIIVMFGSSNLIYFYLSVFIWVILVIVISKAKTNGTWKWRWGDKK